MQSEFFSDRMAVTFDRPCRTIAPRDTLDDPDAERRDARDVSRRRSGRDGGVSVWYAPHPLLRHWLGWMERIDDTHWMFRMEALHIDILGDIPELCGPPITETETSR